MSRIILGAFSSAILLAAPFLAPILFPVAWVAFVPLFWAIARAKNLRGAVFYGWLAGFIAHLVGFYWLVYTINVFGGFPYPVSADRVSDLRRAAGTSDGNLCFPGTRYRLRALANFSRGILGFHRIFVSAFISVALGEQPKFFCLVHSNSRPRGTIRYEFPSHVVQRDCCRRAIQKGARC